MSRFTKQSIAACKIEAVVIALTVMLIVFWTPAWWLLLILGLEIFVFIGDVFNIIYTKKQVRENEKKRS